MNKLKLEDHYVSAKELGQILGKHHKTILRYKKEKWTEGKHYRIAPNGRYVEFNVNAIKTELNTPISKRKKPK